MFLIKRKNQEEKKEEIIQPKENSKVESLMTENNQILKDFVEKVSESQNILL